MVIAMRTLILAAATCLMLAIPGVQAVDVASPIAPIDPLGPCGMLDLFCWVCDKTDLCSGCEGGHQEGWENPDVDPWDGTITFPTGLDSHYVICY